ncbi:MAG: hypothetical protein REH83_00675, partial [Rickettsiella sp.]|nr:hypothetical protein [Rickettsiella sp.]
ALKLLDTNVCAEGFFLKLQQIVYVLNDQTTIFNWLANLRLEIIYRFFYLQDIKSVHNFNTLLNYAQEIGLNVIDANLSTQVYLANDRYHIPLCQVEKKAFINFFCRHYHREVIIKYITQQLENELKMRIKEFQQPIFPLGLVISAQNTFYTIEKKLNGLPIKQLDKLLKPISEENDNYYLLKSTLELEQEVAYYLAKKGVFKKQSQKFKFENSYWKFTIIEGDTLGEYSYISQKIKGFPKEKYSINDFEEKKLYTYFSLEDFYKSKKFLILGQNSFDYFYKQKADFSYCYLKNIDFTKLGASFLLLPYTELKDAFYIQPTLTYNQLICFYKIKKNNNLNNDYVINFFNSKQFFKIIIDILEPKIENHNLFLERHKAALIANGLYKNILEALVEKNIVLNRKLKNIDHKLKCLNYNKSLLSIKSLSFYFALANMILIMGVLFFPLLPIGLGLLLFGILLSCASHIFMKKIETKQMIYCEQLIKLRGEEGIFINLKSKLLEFSEEQLSQKTDLLVEKEVNYKLKTSYSYPTSISTYLLNSSSAPAEISVENSLTNSLCR